VPTDQIRELFTVKVVAIMFIVGGIVFLIIEYLHRDRVAPVQYTEDVSCKAADRWFHYRVYRRLFYNESFISFLERFTFVPFGIYRIVFGVILLWMLYTGTLTDHATV